MFVLFMILVVFILWILLWVQRSWLSGIPKTNSTAVFLQPYISTGFLSKMTSLVGCAIYHTGLIIDFEEPCSGKRLSEVSFGTGGIFWAKAGSLQNVYYTPQQPVFLGICTKPEHQIKGIIDEMKRDYSGSRYALIGCNCHTFCNDLADRLGVEGLPLKYTRIASNLMQVRRRFVG